GAPVAQVPVTSAGTGSRPPRGPAGSARRTGARSWPPSSKAGSAEPFAGSSPTVVTGLLWNEMDAMPPSSSSELRGTSSARGTGLAVSPSSRAAVRSAPRRRIPPRAAAGRCLRASPEYPAPPRRGRGIDSAGRSAARHGMTLTAITNAHVVPIEGDPFDGTVLLRDGRLTALGPELEIPDGAEVVDAAGGWLLPGFVDAHVHLGVAEEGEGWAGEDTNEMTEPVMAAAQAIDAINPVEVGFDDAIIGGI